MIFGHVNHGNIYENLQFQHAQTCRSFVYNANSCITFNPVEYDMNYLLERKKYDRKKSDAEEVLLKMIQSGRVKVGSDEWRKRCEYIEQMDRISSRFQTAYDENI